MRTNIDDEVALSLATAQEAARRADASSAAGAGLGRAGALDFFGRRSAGLLGLLRRAMAMGSTISRSS